MTHRSGSWARTALAMMLAPLLVWRALGFGFLVWLRAMVSVALFGRPR